VRVHERVLAAIAAQDGDAAFRRMQRHLGTYSALAKKIAKPQLPGPKKNNGRTNRKAATRSRRP